TVLVVLLFLTDTSYVTTAWVADLLTAPLGDSTVTGTWKVSSHTHFDFVSGWKVNASVMVQSVPRLLCQLVQLGRFKQPSPSESWHRTCGIVKVKSYVPALRSPQVSPSRFSAGGTPGVSALSEPAPVALVPSPR